MSRCRSTVLVVDDDCLFCDTVEERLASQQVDLVAVQTGADALRVCSHRRVDVVLLDQRLPDTEGASLCPAILDHNEDAKIVFMTAYPSYDNALSAIRAGAFDYLSKPFSPEELELVVGRALRTLDLERLAALHSYEQDRKTEGTILVGSDAGLRTVASQVRAAAAVTAPVLITGETGTGKNVVARCIHSGGPLRKAPFVTVNCTALPESLVEAELFGYERGAFTGAHIGRKGLFEMAEGGTLLLDEIGDMPLHLQGKLLGVLDSRTIRRLGGQAVRPVEVRVMASTSVDLEEAIADRAFREDLYYRLSVIRIRVPPLREHRQDIPALCRHCLGELSDGRPVTLPEDEVTRLVAYDWPGNVRELRNVLERAVILRTTDTIAPSSLIEDRRRRAAPQDAAEASAGAEDRLPTLREVERRHIERALRLLAGNRTRAAEALGISLSTLKRRLREETACEAGEATGRSGTGSF